MKSLPDLSRTKAAIEAYDAFDAEMTTLLNDLPDQEEVQQLFDQLEQFGEAVGIAFGLDTADRNNLEDCKRGIRPGPKVPGPGCEPSFVRRMVAAWETQKGSK